MLLNVASLIPLLLSLTDIDCARILTRQIRTPAGIAYSRAFGSFAAENQDAPHAENMMDLARAAFRVRLTFSEEYDQAFAEQVRNIWFDRVAGTTDSQPVSFATNLSEQKDLAALFDLLSHRLTNYLRMTEPSILQVASFRDPIYMGRRRPVVFWEFPIRLIRGTQITFRIYQGYQAIKDGPQAFRIYHARGRNIPAILEHLEGLWRTILNEKTPEAKKLKALAEWEWLWFWSNPFARAGAITGDSLSLLLQLKLTKLGHKVHIRTNFKAQDHEALSQSKKDYIRTRVAELSSGQP
jgi:hypothetical protein